MNYCWLLLMVKSHRLLVTHKKLLRTLHVTRRFHKPQKGHPTAWRLAIFWPKNGPQKSKSKNPLMHHFTSFQQVMRKMKGSSKIRFSTDVPLKHLFRKESVLNVSGSRTGRCQLAHHRLSERVQGQCTRLPSQSTSTCRWIYT